MCRCPSKLYVSVHEWVPGGGVERWEGTRFLDLVGIVSIAAYAVSEALFIQHDML